MHIYNKIFLTECHKIEQELAVASEFSMPFACASAR